MGCYMCVCYTLYYYRAHFLQYTCNACTSASYPVEWSHVRYVRQINMALVAYTLRQEHIRGRSVELRGTAFDFEHLFSNSVYGHPLHGEYPLRSVALITLPCMYA